MSLEIKVLGKDEHAYAQVVDGVKWYATVKPEHAEAVKDAIADAISQQSNPSD
jgi:hypothetical protein